MKKPFRLNILASFWTSRWLVWAIAGLAFLLRLPLLNASFWLDEAAQAWESARPLSQQLMIVDDFQPPLIHLLVHVLIQFSQAEWWLRLGAALIPGVVTVWATYMIGRKLWSPLTGTVASLLLATSSFHIFYSQELRPYALPAMFGSLSWWALLEKKPKWWLVVLFTIGGCYSSYLYPFLFLTQIIYFLFWHKQWRRQILLVAAGVSAAFLPWVPSLLGQLHAGQMLQIALPGWGSIVGGGQLKNFALVWVKFLFGVVHVGLQPIWFVVLLGLAGTAVLMIQSIFQKRRMLLKSKEVWLVVFWLVLPIVFAELISLFVPILQPKRVLYCLPAFYLALAYAIQLLQPRLQKAVLIFFVFLNLGSTWAYYTQPQYQREDWRGMHELIVNTYPADRSTVLFAFPQSFVSWTWYDHDQYPAITTGHLTVQNVDQLENLKQVTQYQYILLFDYLRDLSDPKNLVPATLQQYGYHEVDRITPSTPMGIVHVYARTSSTLSLR